MICSNLECAKDFDPKTHNQKYCNEQCCRVATNRKIMEKYYEKKAIKNGAERSCKFCKTKLSRYNQLSVCSTCEKNITNESKKILWGIISELS
jgi:hypothetical protein